MAETTPIDLRLIDKRTADRYIRLGLLDEKAWEKHLKSLPDVAEKGTDVETEIAGSDALDEAGEDEPGSA